MKGKKRGMKDKGSGHEQGSQVIGSQGYSNSDWFSWVMIR